MIRLDASTLHRCQQSLDTLDCSKAASIVRAFGELAPWWLNPALLHKAATHQPAYDRYCKAPELPESIGSCWAILACKQDLLLLRSAMLLPLCWVQHAPHQEERLPSPLQQLGNRVREQLEDSSWNLSLHPDCGLRDLDLSQLNNELTWESSWASLAGGLYLAKMKIQPSKRIWASIAYDSTFGIGKVDQVAKKLELADEFGVKAFYLPEVNREIYPSRSSVRYIAGNADKSREIGSLLSPYLEAIGIEPYHSALGVRKNFYQTAERKRAEAFYLKSLVTELASKCLGDLSLEQPQFRPSHLVSVVGEYPSNTALACELIKQLAVEAESKVLLLHNGTPAIQAVLDQIKSRFPGVFDRKIDIGERSVMVEQITTILRDTFQANVPSESIAFDLTPGFKNIILALMEAAPFGSWFLYCRHDRDRGKPKLGTERYDCWQKK